MGEPQPGRGRELPVQSPLIMAPVTRINGAPIGGGRPCGPMFERLLAPWNTKIGLDLRQQILGAT